MYTRCNIEQIKAQILEILRDHGGGPMTRGEMFEAGLKCRTKEVAGLILCIMCRRGQLTRTLAPRRIHGTPFTVPNSRTWHFSIPALATDQEGSQP